MTPQSLELIGVVTGSGVGGVALAKVFDWFTDRATSKKMAKRTEAESGKFDAEAVQAITAAAISLVAPLQAEISELRGRVETLESENQSHQTLLQSAIEYIRILLTWINDRITDQSPPQPPTTLGI